jgi:RNA-binding protein
VLHVTPSRSIIVKVEKTPRIGEKVVDEKLQQVGTVFDIFGPVSSPYVAVKTTINNPDTLKNQLLYVVPSPKQGAKGKEKRKHG